MKIPIPDRKKEIPLCNHRKNTSCGDGSGKHAGDRFAAEKFFCNRKNSAETERYQRIYSDNNSESTLSDIRRVQFNWFVDKQL